MFPSLTGNGRIWIYVAQRPLSEVEAMAVKLELNAFCASWAAHGTQLSADFDIYHRQILVLAVDEDVEAASGCSIDKATAIIQKVDADLRLDLFNRMNLAFLDNDAVRVVKMQDINQAYQTEMIGDDTVFFDNTISKLGDLRTRWQIPFSSSWAYRKVKQLSR